MQIAIKCLYLIPLTFYLLFAGCEKDFAPISKNPDSEPVESKLHLDLIDTDVREAWLRLTVDSTFNADTIEVTREQYIIYRDTMMVRDTVIYDYYFPLTPDPVYYYRAYAKHKGRKIQITEPQEAQMLPVTSHNYTWEIDTIGTFMSILEGVWGTAPDNVYAVGTIYLPNFPPYNSTRIVHWDGKIWQPLNFDGNGPEAIFGFSDSDFWIAGDWGSPSTQRAYIGYWNGTNWQHWQLEFETLKAIWGTSSSNMYAVGVQGEIIHFDGASWTSMPSGTDYLLNDIWGTSENDIYITGRNSATGEGILLKYDEGTWEKIYDGHSIQGIPLSGQAITIWGQNPYKYYLYTTSVDLSIGFDHKFVWWNHGFPNDNVLVRRIRGSEYNNLFAIGAFGLIIHFNGQIFQRYDQFYRKPQGDVLNGIWSFENNVFIVGKSENYTGIVYRGKR